MPVTRRELIRRLSALYGAGVAGLLPTSARATDAEGNVAKPDSAPAATAALTAPGLPVWDGISGGTGVMFNKGAVLPWENLGGDWHDADGVVQGPKPLATVLFAAAGAFEVDLSAFAGKLADGLLLRGHGAIRIGSRYNTDPAQRPILVCDGVAIPCRASAPLAISSTSPQAVPDPVFGDGANMMLQFDVPAGTKSARLRMTVTKWYSGKQSADVFLLRTPKLFDGGVAQQGIAAKYDHDIGINADPAVYFSTKFDDDWIKTLFPEGSIIAPAMIAPDPDLGVPALSAHYKIGEVGGMWYDHKWSSRDPKMRPGTTDPTLPADKIRLNNPGTPDELYFRYYLMLGPGYQCHVQGKKLPGLAWRYGWWNFGGAGGGYYYPMCGNGGARSTGKYGPDSTGRMTLCGGSMRHLAHEGPKEVGNPVGDRIVLGYYAYHAEMKDFFGDFWRWGDAKRGYVNIQQGRWYCVEHRVKMNSIDLSAPDANGNGKGNRDGIVQGWLDGVLVFDKRNVVMRHHPAFKVDEVWLAHYHGGLDPAEAEHPYKMAALVVAKQYIGPMRGVTPGGTGPGTPPPPPQPPGTPPAPPENVQGLWWAPGGTESGWGVNFVHQGSQVFATWYTYDTAGEAWWLSMLATKTTGATYTGPIYATTGLPFNTLPFTSMTASPTQVGTGTLTFKDANTGSFTYTVDATPSQTKAISRFDLATGAQPTCTYSATTPDFAAATNYQDLWWVANGAESGWGVNLAHQGNSVFATWYTYDVSGTPRWLSVLAGRVGTTNAYTGTLYRSSGPRFDAYDPAKLIPVQVGTATLIFIDGNTADFHYTTTGVGGLPIVTQTKRITRFRFAATGGTLCQ